MNSFKPSRFDQMLEAADEIIRQGFFMADDDVPPAEELCRELSDRPVRLEPGYDD